VGTEYGGNLIREGPRDRGTWDQGMERTVEERRIERRMERKKEFAAHFSDQAIYAPTHCQPNRMNFRLIR
jgi:hypothetical protein